MAKVLLADRQSGRVVTGQQIVDLLAILGVDEGELSMVRHVEISPCSVRITRTVRGASGGVLMDAAGHLAEHVETVPISWRGA